MVTDDDDAPVHGHFIDRCSCGIVINQCRCPSKDKTLTTINRGCIECRTKKAESEKLRIDVCGLTHSGKSTIMKVIYDALGDAGFDVAIPAEVDIQPDFEKRVEAVKAKKMIIDIHEVQLMRSF
jgi:hypothetical protein